MPSTGTIINHNQHVIADVRKHNEGIRAAAKKDLMHEIDCTTKDVKNYDFNGRQNFVISGFGEKKETLSHKIFVFQARLSKESELYRKITGKIRRFKNFISGILFKKKYIPGTPRLYK